jgi:hypothetical protein
VQIGDPFVSPSGAICARYRRRCGCVLGVQGAIVAPAVQKAVLTGDRLFKAPSTFRAGVTSHDAIDRFVRARERTARVTQL